MKKNWSEMTIEEHLDAAQKAFEATPTQVNGLHRGLIEAQMHAQAALALSGQPVRPRA